MRSNSNSDRNLSPTANYAPSVPLSVYRELAVELQSAKLLSDSLNAQNQQLAKQNQQLRQEIAKAVESILRLEKVVKSQTLSNRSASVPKRSDTKHIYKIPKVTEGNLPFPPKKPISVAATTIEQEQGRYRRPKDIETSAVSGWFLALSIILIMVTAFGAGYFLMRPLIRSR